MIAVDASAVVAILAGEDDARELARALEAASASGAVILSTINAWEAACGLARIRRVSRIQALAIVEQFAAIARISLSPPDAETLRLAVEAAERFGKGGQGAVTVLNMGDCFAYATARRFQARLLFKGDDFPQTDIEPAR
jgi:ribonuclease VapC